MPFLWAWLISSTFVESGVQYFLLKIQMVQLNVFAVGYGYHFKGFHKVGLLDTHQGLAL